MSISDVKFSRAGDQVILEGQTLPNTEVEAENLSAAPFGPSLHPDSFSRVQADADGHFRMAVASGEEGDRVRLHGRRGQEVDVVSVRVTGTASLDGRRAEVAQQALRLVPDDNGGFSFTSVSQNPKVSEPGAQLKFTNRRTGEAVTFTLDDDGLLPAGARLAGVAGDTFEISASDGNHNPNLTESWSFLVAPPELRPGDPFEPPLGHDEVGGRFAPTLRPYGGDLFMDGIDANDPTQGAVGDCYLVGGVASIAARDPDAIRRLFSENDDGTVTVRFKAFDRIAGQYVDVPITVTRELYTKRGRPLYGASSNTRNPGAMELWFPLLEKAYAAWKGGFDGIQSGYACEVFEAILGREGRHFDPAAMGADAIWSQLRRAERNDEPVLAWTHPDSLGRPYANTSLVADHAYSVIGTEERNGERYVQIRNPWGCRPGDGNFSVPLAELVRYFYGVAIARPD